MKKLFKPGQRVFLPKKTQKQFESISEKIRGNSREPGIADFMMQYVGKIYTINKYDSEGYVELNGIRSYVWLQEWLDPIGPITYKEFLG